VEWYYPDLGIWMRWETPVVLFSLSRGLPDQAKTVLRTCCPIGGEWLLWLLEAEFTPRESLLEVGWTAWGLKWAWQFERCEE
jgi:hypothetical protein